MTQLITTLRVDNPSTEQNNAVKGINSLIDFLHQKVHLHGIEVPAHVLSAIDLLRKLAVCYEEALIKDDELLVVIIEGGSAPKETRREYSRAINTVMDYVNQLVSSRDSEVPAYIISCASILTDISLSIVRASINDDRANYL